MIESARDLRGQYEEVYGEGILNDDVIDTVVDNFRIDASNMGFDPIDILDEQRKLFSTLEWSTVYNALNSEEF